jgi:hypothetical protein
MNKYLLCDKVSGKVICEKFGEDFQYSDDGLHDFIVDSTGEDNKILWCWSHDSYLVGVEYDVEPPKEQPVVLFQKKG